MLTRMGSNALAAFSALNKQPASRGLSFALEVDPVTLRIKGAVGEYPAGLPVLVKDPVTGRRFQTTLRDVQALERQRAADAAAARNWAPAARPQELGGVVFRDAREAPKAPPVAPPGVLVGEGTRQVKADATKLQTALQTLEGTGARVYTPSASRPTYHWTHSFETSGTTQRTRRVPEAGVEFFEDWKRSVAVVRNGDRYEVVVVETSPVRQLRGGSKRDVEVFRSHPMTKSALEAAMTSRLGIKTTFTKRIERGTRAYGGPPPFVDIEVALKGR